MEAKTTKIIYWIVTILFFGFLLFGAVTELTHSKQADDLLVSLKYPIYVNTIIGIAKILGAISIFQWQSKTLKEWAYAGFTIDIIGAAASMYFAGIDTGSVIFTAAFLIPLFISYFLWKKIEAVKS